MATTEGLLAPVQERVQRRVRLGRTARLLLRNRLAVLGAGIILLLAVVALAAPLLAPPADPDRAFEIPRDGYQPDPSPPSAAHPLGTTQSQYDLWYGLVWGARTAFMVGLLLPGLTLLIGATIGALAAYAGGWADEITQRVVEVFMAFPFLLAALTLASVLAPRLHNPMLSAMIALVAFGWPGYARLIRGEVLSVKGRDYVLGARVIGARHRQILLRHVLPNALPTLVVFVALDVGGSVLAFSGLSFLGLGAPEGYADWGGLLSYARNWLPMLSTYWYIVVFPGGALLLFSLGWNLVGDALRDVLDPRMRSRA